MTEPIKWIDPYYKSENRITLTENELHIPGIRIFGTHKVTNAINPLLRHYHESAFEFTYVDKGSVLFFTDEKEYEVFGGHIFVSFPNEIHSTNNVPITLGKQYWFQLEISKPDHFLFLNEAAAGKLINALYHLDHLIPLSDVKIFRSIIKKAFDSALNGEDRYLLASYFVVLLYMIIGSQKISVNKESDIEDIIQYIKDHITEELSLDFLASQCQLSTSHFKQKFRNITGVSPRNYINYHKIDYAKKELLSGKSITDVSMELGFNTSSYFSAVFKKYTTKSPRDYIKSHSLS